MGRVQAAGGDRSRRTDTRLVAPRHEPGRSARLAARAARRVAPEVRRSTPSSSRSAPGTAEPSRTSRRCAEPRSRLTPRRPSKLHLVAFDLLELAGDDLRSLPWVKRTELLRECFPAGDRLRLVQTRPASRAAHDQLVALGFEGSVLKRPGSTYRPGRQTTWRKYKASHRATATLSSLRPGRDGHTYAISELDGRRVTTLASPRLAALIGHRVELAYSRIDADGSLREVRISAVDVASV